MEEGVLKPMEMYYIITCDAGVKEKIRVSARQYEDMGSALADAGRAAEAYKKKVTVCELSNNEEQQRKLFVKRVVRSDGEVIVCSTVGTVCLY